MKRSVKVTLMRLRPGWNAAFVAFCALIAALEVPITYSMLLDPAPTQLLLAWHLALFALCVVWAWLVVPPAPELGDLDVIPDDPHRGLRFWSVALCVVMLLLSAPGVLCITAGFVFYLLSQRNSRPFAEWYAELFPEQSLDLDERIYDALLLTAAQHEDPANVTPFSDVISFGTKEDKELAINMMRRYFEAPFTPILRMALDDSNNSVRIQAATAITHLETRFAETLVELESDVEEHATPRAVFELAWHLDRYAYSGLTDPERSARMRVRAREAYERFLRAQPDNLQTHIAVGRLLLRSGEAQRARDYLEQARATFGDDPRLDTWLMEAYFAVKDYAKLRALARAAMARSEAASDGSIVGEAVRLWAGAASRPVRHQSA